MRWLSALNENIRRGIRNWLHVDGTKINIQIQETIDFETNAIRNQIWYRGDSNELEQLYSQTQDYADKYKFWASKCSPGMEMRKIHTGLPGLIVKVLTAIVMADMNDFDFESSEQEEIWKEIQKKNDFQKKLKRTLRQTLSIGDGAWKIVMDTVKSQYPRIQWFSGDRVELVYDGDDLQEVVFKTPYKIGWKLYTLHECYGYGYIRNEVYLGDQAVDTSVLGQKKLQDWTFDESVMLAVPFQVYDSVKWEGRGGSIFDGKLDSFDAFDEAWSQWMQALRAGRAKTYIPESLIPKHPDAGKILRPNPFDNSYIKTDSDMGENAKNQIDTEQPAIPHESYLASYVTALDLCLQGIISPSTLGIDMKKLDNAEAQREKEKTTLYTRNAIVEALQETLPLLVTAALHGYYLSINHALDEVKVDIPFGEYANPSFESQVETVAKGKQGGIMSIEASVEELYGDSKDETWKKEEVARLKAEQGITEVEEPAVSQDAGSFHVNLDGGKQDAGQSNEPGVPNEPEGVPGASAGGQ